MVPVVVDCAGRGLRAMFTTDAEEWELDQAEATRVSVHLVRANLWRGT